MVALTIPLVLAATFFVMSVIGIDLQRISLGALIIALGLLVDDAMIAVEMMERKLEEGFDKLAAASFAYTSTAFPMLTGTLITVAGFIPVGFARLDGGRICQLAVLGGRHLAGHLLVRGGLFHALDRLRAAEGRTRRPSADHEAFDSRSTARSGPSSPGACATGAPWWSLTFACAGCERRRLRVHPAAVLPDLEPAGNPGRPVAAGGHIVPGDRARRPSGSSSRLASDTDLATRRDLHRRGRAALLPAARPAAPEPELRAAARHAEVDSRRASD